MKKTRALVMSLVVAIAAVCSMQASAQFRFGLKAGMNVSSMDFSSKVFDSENRAGFTGGAMMEFTVPLVGVGFDLSAMYVHRTDKIEYQGTKGSNNRDYIEIPLNLKYKLSLPLVSKFVSPFVTTGPSVSFLTTKRAIDEAMKNKSVDWAWNFGLGVQLVNKVQIAASYGLGLSKALNFTGVTENAKSINGKNRYWTITAAYLF